MKRALCFVLIVGAATLLLILLLTTSHQQQMNAQNSLWPERQQLVQQLGVTDLALWSEARYTRHPSQADLFTPFQNAPGALDHFPAGSILPPAMPFPTTQVVVYPKGSGS